MKTSRRLLICLLALAAGPSCDRQDTDEYLTDGSSYETVSHDRIILGEKLDDPYSVTNIT